MPDLLLLRATARLAHVARTTRDPAEARRSHADAQRVLDLCERAEELNPALVTEAMEARQEASTAIETWSRER